MANKRIDSLSQMESLDGNTRYGRTGVDCHTTTLTACAGAHAPALPTPDHYRDQQAVWEVITRVGLRNPLNSGLASLAFRPEAMEDAAVTPDYQPPIRYYAVRGPTR